MQGKITQIIGPVVDVYFEGELPAIYDALKVQLTDGKTVTLEVAIHMGDHVVRTISLEPTEGLKRDLVVIGTMNSVMVPVGPMVLGRIFNVLGEPIDDGKSLDEAPKMSIHR
ncbi:MAG TPA: F0F1 ATP synthase subunit beta, partial [Acholeplasmataceae bacterium]|nr:F0F1 ATP synthase subunit beta [Acholeplasmataceae bacterium]